MMTVMLEEDPDTGELVLPLPEDVVIEVGWQIGDRLVWIDNYDGTWTLKKKQ